MPAAGRQGRGPRAARPIDHRSRTYGTRCGPRAPLRAACALHAACALPAACAARRMPFPAQTRPIIGTMSDADVWSSALARTTDTGRATAEAVRALVRRLHPDVVEVVWPNQGTVGWGVGPRKMSEHYAYLAVHPKHVNLGFYRGAALADPAGVLSGTGKEMRHVRLTSPDDVDRPELVELLRAARAEREAARGPVRSDPDPPG